MPRLYTNARDAFPYGQGSKEFAERFGKGNSDVSTIEHEYRGHRLIPGNEANAYKWTIEAIGFNTHPSLKGQWTSVFDAEKAIDRYWSSQEASQMHVK